MIKNIFIFSAILALSPVLVSAQSDIPIGTWRTHFSYYDTRHVEEAGNRIYASSENGLYYFDKEDNSITKISKIDGLQSEDISALYYDQNTDLLLIGYRSGNLDVIKDHVIINIDLNSTSQISSSKTINHITAFQSFAYLSTDFGVLKFDLNKLEVTETLRELGEGASLLRVNQSIVVNDSLFLATEEGVIAADIVQNINLLDYQNWRRFDLSDGIPAAQVHVITRLGSRVVAGISMNGLYVYDGKWQPAGILDGASFHYAGMAGDKIIVVHDDNVSFVTSTLQPEPLSIDFVTGPKEGVIDQEGFLWIADGAKGLISDYSGTFGIYTPPGPLANDISQLSYAKNTIYALPGGYSTGLVPKGNELGFYAYSNGTWNNYNTASSKFNIPEFKDIVDAAYSEHHKSLFLASVGYGLLQINNNGDKTIIDENAAGSPLENLNSVERNVLIPAITAEKEGLWVLNYGADQPLHLLKSDGTWQSFSFNLNIARYAIDLIVIGRQVWMMIDPARGGGIFVYDYSSGDSRYLTEVSDNGGLANKNVNAIAVDREGLVWSGTDKGVSVFTDPFSVFNGAVNAIEPIFGNRYLLTDEKVVSIEVDGGNRKWMGTSNGVWLFNESGDEQVLNFNTTNSPLPENHVSDIEINEQSGEVFFATRGGLVSYRGSATASGPEHSNVKIFPNPVTADFKGTVGISGLATDAIIKITDMSGKLIWQTQANGGTALWNVSDYKGNRAATGVYLVFSASEDGEDSFVGKIAVLN